MRTGNLLLKGLNACSIAYPSINMTFFVTGAINDLEDIFIYTEFPLETTLYGSSLFHLRITLKWETGSGSWIICFSKHKSIGFFFFRKHWSLSTNISSGSFLNPFNVIISVKLLCLMEETKTIKWLHVIFLVLLLLTQLGQLSTKFKQI